MASRWQSGLNRSSARATAGASSNAAATDDRSMRVMNFPLGFGGNSRARARSNERATRNTSKRLVSRNPPRNFAPSDQDGRRVSFLQSGDTAPIAGQFPAQ